MSTNSYTLFHLWLCLVAGLILGVIIRQGFDSVRSLDPAEEVFFAGGRCVPFKCGGREYLVIYVQGGQPVVMERE